MPINRLYLIGHGFESVSVNPVPGFHVPQRLHACFYVNRDDFFDSRWEAFIRAGRRDFDAWDWKIVQETKDAWGPEDFPPGAVCPAYVLTRPGGIQGVLPWSAIKEIRLAEDGTCSIPDALADGDTLAIKRGGKPGMGQGIPPGEKDLPVYTTLERILGALTAAIPPQDTTTEIHWLACRNRICLDPPRDHPSYDDLVGQVNDMKEQARGVYKDP